MALVQVGAHYAARDLLTWRADRALAAGVSLTLSAQKSSAFTITGNPALPPPPLPLLPQLVAADNHCQPCAAATGSAAATLPRLLPLGTVLALVVSSARHGCLLLQAC